MSSATLKNPRNRPAASGHHAAPLPPDLQSAIEFFGGDEPIAAVSVGAAELPLSDEAPRAAADPSGELLYSNRLREWPLLTRDDEFRLFSRMNGLRREAESLRKTLAAGRGNGGLVRRIRRRLQSARQVRNYIVSCNLRLLVSVAGAAVQRPGELDDLVSEGQLALIRAVELFDYTRGLRFSTYATWAIRNTLARSQQKNARYRHRFAIGLDSGGLDQPCDRSPEPEFSDVPPAPQVVQRLLRGLPDRERTVLELRFGLTKSGRELRFREIGEELGVSTERARQLVSRGLLKLQDLAQDAGVTLDE
ncbi:MAG TPA: sigma-70 family RNA polymerase sigma factor [Planctomycetaceae bacterium]|jgi:RNA polymerase primary sigma factor/RNA polymerase sigma factor|nr:sigma-70 family RNA polymerase sigma factor [Planctomycetaceae bacterium]